MSNYSELLQKSLERAEDNFSMVPIEQVDGATRSYLSYFSASISQCEVKYEDIRRGVQPDIRELNYLKSIGIYQARRALVAFGLFDDSSLLQALPMFASRSTPTTVHHDAISREYYAKNDAYKSIIGVEYPDMISGEVCSITDGNESDTIIKLRGPKTGLPDTHLDALKAVSEKSPLLKFHISRSTLKYMSIEMGTARDIKVQRLFDMPRQK